MGSSITFIPSGSNNILTWIFILRDKTFLHLLLKVPGYGNKSQMQPFVLIYYVMIHILLLSIGLDLSTIFNKSNCRDLICFHISYLLNR